MSNTCRIGVGGPVGSGKTALIEAITPYFLKLGLQVLIITNDIVTTEDANSACIAHNNFNFLDFNS